MSEVRGWPTRHARSSDEFTALYESENLAMVRMARLMVGSVAVAEELVHDAFATVFERRGVIDDQGAYLRQVVVNNCRASYRRDRRRRELDQLLHAGDSRDAVTLPVELDETWAALSALKPKQRIALVLRFYSDLPISDIAGVMGERPGTVKSLIHRGLRQLRKDLTR